MKKLLLFSLCMVFIVLALANVMADDGVYQKDAVVDLKIACFDNNATSCNNSATCEISIFRPDNTILIDNLSMTNNINYFNYTLQTNETEELGEYRAITICRTGQYAGYSSFIFKITATGKAIEGEYSIAILIGLFVFIIIIIGSGYLIAKGIEKAYPMYLGIIIAMLFLTSTLVVMISLSKGETGIGIIENNFIVWVWIIRIALAGGTIGMILWALKQFLNIGKPEVEHEEEEYD